MSYRICETLETEKQAMRDVYCQTMIDLANQNDRIVVMDADLMNSVGTVPFGEAHSERTVNCGIQEANMIGVAAGMSAVGMVPYCHTFGPSLLRPDFCVCRLCQSQHPHHRQRSRYHCGHEWRHPHAL